MGNKRTFLSKIKVGIIGAAGITGEKLISLLLGHKFIKLELLVSESNAGKSVDEIHKALKGLIDKKFEDLNLSEIVKKCDCVFLCKGHGEFVKNTVELFKLAKKNNKKQILTNQLKVSGLKIIDLSADFRLKNPLDYEKWYKFSHPARKLLKNAVYGLPEIYYKDIKNADIVANPGCYPTAIIMALAPLFKNNLVVNKVFTVAYSGVSGAGVKPNERNIAISVLENIMPYRVSNHQHTPEIEQELKNLVGKDVCVVFVPNIVPFKDGILSTSFMTLNKKVKAEDIYKLYKEFYNNCKFVRIYRPGEYPGVKNVVHTNFCDIGFELNEKSNTLVVISAIDNLIKGASGQAIQNMNIMFGLQETEGLI